MMGAMAEGGDIGLPSHPAEPMAQAAERMTTRSALKVPVTERVSRKTVRPRTRNMIGNRVVRSVWVASLKALESATEPVRATSIFG